EPIPHASHSTDISARCFMDSQFFKTEDVSADDMRIACRVLGAAPSDQDVKWLWLLALVGCGAAPKVAVSTVDADVTEPDASEAQDAVIRDELGADAARVLAPDARVVDAVASVDGPAAQRVRRGIWIWDFGVHADRSDVVAARAASLGVGAVYIKSGED